MPIRISRAAFISIKPKHDNDRITKQKRMHILDMCNVHIIIKALAALHVCSINRWPEQTTKYVRDLKECAQEIERPTH